MRIERYATVPLPVTAVQLTEDNLQEVAEWCNGSICPSLIPDNPPRVECTFRDERHLALVGEWIVSYSPTEFYPYPDELFKERFLSY